MKSIFYAFFIILFAKENATVVRYIESDHYANTSVSDTFFTVSKPFMVNQLRLFWKSTITAEGGIHLELKEMNTKRTLLTHSDITQHELDFYKNPDYYAEEQHAESFKDLNFDGYIDFFIYSKQNSGSGGAFFDVYLFDHRKKYFYHSEELSGGEIEIDTVKKTISTYWKSGVAWNTNRIHHFGKKGKIKFVETITREVLPGDTVSLLKTTHEKVIGQKVKTTIDTTIFEGY